MPKAMDPAIREQVLQAAARLLDSGSESAVTMRVIADETGVAVTTIYERFESREGLLHALTAYLAEDEAERFAQCQQVEQVFESFLKYAQEHPHRYKLLSESFLERLATGGALPGFELLKDRLARKLGGVSNDHDELALGITELMAGTVTGLLISLKNTEYQANVKRAGRSTLELILCAAVNDKKTTKPAPKRRTATSH